MILHGKNQTIVDAGATQSSSKNSSASIGVSFGAGGFTFSAGGSLSLKDSRGVVYVKSGQMWVDIHRKMDCLGVKSQRSVQAPHSLGYAAVCF